MRLSLYILQLFVIITSLLVMSNTSANMGKPRMDEGKSATAPFGLTDFKVTHETIDIQVLSNPSPSLQAKYNVKYQIKSDKNITLPLSFLAVDLELVKSVSANGKPLTYQTYNLNATNKHQFDSWAKQINRINQERNPEVNTLVNPKDFFLFNAPLNAGKNTIEIAYNTDLTRYYSDYISTYELNYSLYPSKFWQSFGNIDIYLSLPKNLEVKNSSINNFTQKGNVYHGTITDVNQDILIELQPKLSLIARFFYLITPFGVGLISLLGMLVWHIRYLYRNQFDRKIFWLGVFLLPLLNYGVILIANTILPHLIGEYGNEQQGFVYGFLFYCFAYPIIVILYLTIVASICHLLKRHQKANRRSLTD